MISFHNKINANYGWELNFLYSPRKLSDGLTVFNHTINFDWFKGDHKPSFEWTLEILNWYLFEFQLYNLNHLDEGKIIEPDFKNEVDKL